MSFKEGLKLYNNGFSLVYSTGKIKYRNWGLEMREVMWTREEKSILLGILFIPIKPLQNTITVRLQDPN